MKHVCRGDLQASIDSHVPVTVVEKRMQGRDHPVLLGVPETYYLKCFMLRGWPRRCANRLGMMSRPPGVSRESPHD